MLIVEFNYQKYAIVDAALTALMSALEVEEKYIGHTKKYYIKEEQRGCEIKVVKPDQLVYSDDEITIQEDAKTLLEEAKAESLRYSKYWSDEQKKTRELEAQVKALKELCPESHKKEGEEEI